MFTKQQEARACQKIAEDQTYKLVSINPMLRQAHHQNCTGFYQVVMTASKAYLEGWSAFVFENESVDNKSDPNWKNKPVISFGFDDSSDAFMEIHDLILKGNFDWNNFPENQVTKLFELFQKNFLKS